MRGPRTGVGCLALAALVLSSSGCGAQERGRSVASAATVPTAPRALTTTTTAVPLDVVPPVIDLAYASRVLAAIEERENEAMAEFVAAHGPTAGWDHLLTTLFDGSALEFMRSQFGRRAAENEVYADDRGPVTSVLEVVDTAPHCIVMWVDREWRVRGSDRARWLIELRSHPPTPENPTAWRIKVMARSTAQFTGPIDETACE